jgi:3-hydroxyisobutyrate dehydrogenase-like beta-hydroxyacid dehydrogenase
LNIGFIGIGKMGLPMARHLAAAGHALTACDADAAARTRAQAAGLDTAATVAEATSRAEVLVSSLPDDAALLAVAAALAAAPGRVATWVDTSTVGLAASAHAAQQVQAAGVAPLRATVSGNAAMAEAAQLTVMASGPRAAYERIEPLLACWGPQRFWLGAGEQARLMKLVVNLMIAQTTEMLAEALALGQKGGLSLADLWRVIACSAVASPIVKAKSVPLAQRDYTPTFTVMQMQRDLGLILDAGHELAVPLPMTQAALAHQRAAAQAGMAGDDYAAVIRLAERAAGLGDLR